MRIKFKTSIKRLTVPEVIRPRPIEAAIEQLRQLGLVEENPEGEPKIFGRKQRKRKGERWRNH